jgi:uncharacterized Tic20 family protein
MKKNKINKLTTIIILVALVIFLITCIVGGSIYCAVKNITYPTEILVGLISSLIVAVFPLCTKILEVHNEKDKEGADNDKHN